MLREAKEKRAAIFAAITTFAGASLMFQPSGGFGSNIGDAVTNFFGEIFGGIQNQIQNLLNVTISSITTQISEIIDSLVGPITEALGGIESIIGGWVQAVISPFNAIAGSVGITGPIMTVNVTRTLGVPGIGWAMAGVALMGLGSTIVTGTDIPIIGRFGSGLGSIFIITGAMTGAYGLFPDMSKIIFMILFVLVFAAGAWTYTSIARQIDEDNPAE